MILLCSPFLRTVQTAFHVAKHLPSIYNNTIYFQQEIAEHMMPQYVNYNKNTLDELISHTTKDLQKYIDLADQKI